MTSNKHTKFILDIDRTRASLSILTGIVDQLISQTSCVSNYLEEAQRGDPRRYLYSGIVSGFDAVSKSRKASAELSEVIDRVRQTIRNWEQHEQSVHVDPVAIELPTIISALPTVPSVQFDDIMERSDEVGSTVENVVLKDRSLDNETVSVEMKIHSPSVDTINFSTKAEVQEPIQLENAETIHTDSSVTPVTDSTYQLMPENAKNVKFTPENQSFWNRILEFFSWLGQKIKDLFARIQKISTEIITDILSVLSFFLTSIPMFITKIGEIILSLFLTLVKIGEIATKFVASLILVLLLALVKIGEIATKFVASLILALLLVLVKIGEIATKFVASLILALLLVLVKIGEIATKFVVEIFVFFLFLVLLTVVMIIVQYGVSIEVLYRFFEFIRSLEFFGLAVVMLLFGIIGPLYFLLLSSLLKRLKPPSGYFATALNSEKILSPFITKYLDLFGSLLTGNDHPVSPDNRRPLSDAWLYKQIPPSQEGNILIAEIGRDEQGRERYAVFIPGTDFDFTRLNDANSLIKGAAPEGLGYNSEYYENIVRVLSKLPPDTEVNLIGHSLGAMVARKLVHDKRLSHLNIRSVTSFGGPRTDGDEDKKGVKYKDYIEAEDSVAMMGRFTWPYRLSRSDIFVNTGDYVDFGKMDVISSHTNYDLSLKVNTNDPGFAIDPDYIEFEGGDHSNFDQVKFRYQKLVYVKSSKEEGNSYSILRDIGD
jgi:hypothetical protein